MILPDIGEKRSDIQGQLHEVRRSVTETRNARRSENTSIGEGGLRLYDTGGLTVDDGGAILMRGGGEMRGDDGGKISLYHPGNQVPCVQAGTFVDDGGTGYGIAAFTNTFKYLFSAAQSGDYRYATLGDNDLPLNKISMYATDVEMTTTGGSIYLNPDNGGLYANLSPGTGEAVQRETAGSGKLVRVVSSRRYKQDIEDLDIDADSVLRLRPRRWRFIEQVNVHGDAAPEAAGFIAEEVADAGLESAVVRNADGEPESLNNRALIAGLVTLCQRQQEQLEAQQQQIGDLSRRLAVLEGQ
jgi:Chaperone of endosialidase